MRRVQAKLKVFAEAIANINLAKPNSFYFFYDLDSYEYHDVLYYFDTWCDILHTEGGWIVKSHKSFDYERLLSLLVNTKFSFPRADYQIQMANNLWIRTSAKWVQQNGSIITISGKPTLRNCPNGQECPYVKANKLWLRKRYETNW